MRFLIDEMFPPSVCDLLTEAGHDAISVFDCGLAARPDVEVAAAAQAQDRVVVTENVQDFASAAGVVVVCVLKPRLGVRTMAADLAALLHAWAERSPEPYPGLHWPG